MARSKKVFQKIYIDRVRLKNQLENIPSNNTFQMLVLLVEYIFLTTFYDQYFNQYLHKITKWKLLFGNKNMGLCLYIHWRNLIRGYLESKPTR